MNIIDEREMRIKKQQQQRQKKAGGTGATVKGWELNDFAVGLS